VFRKFKKDIRKNLRSNDGHFDCDINNVQSLANDFTQETQPNKFRHGSTVVLFFFLLIERIKKSRQTNKQANKQTNKQKNKQENKQIDRQTDKQKYIRTYSYKQTGPFFIMTDKKVYLIIFHLKKVQVHFRTSDSEYAASPNLYYLLGPVSVLTYKYPMYSIHIAIFDLQDPAFFDIESFDRAIWHINKHFTCLYSQFTLFPGLYIFHNLRAIKFPYHYLRCTL